MSPEKIQELERREAEGYRRYPDSEDEDLKGWGEVAAWPDDDCDWDEYAEEQTPAPSDNSEPGK